MIFKNILPHPSRSGAALNAPGVTFNDSRPENTGLAPARLITDPLIKGRGGFKRSFVIQSK